MTDERTKQANESADMWAAHHKRHAIEAADLLRGLEDGIRRAVLRTWNAEQSVRLHEIDTAVASYRKWLVNNLTYVPQMPADHHD